MDSNWDRRDLTSSGVNWAREKSWESADWARPRAPMLALFLATSLNLSFVCYSIISISQEEKGDSDSMYLRETH